MKYAVLSDIHGNLEALNSVLEEVDRQKIDQIICCGDIIGYGANPNECCRLLFERNPISILGNHDQAGFDLEEAKYFNIYAQESAQWTYNTLEDSYREILRALPHKRLVGWDFLLVHGALTHRNDYILADQQAIENKEVLQEKYPHIRLCFYGHSHLKKIWGPVEGSLAARLNFRLLQDEYYLINPGSIGQPRDGDPRASFLTFERETMEIKYYLVDYDIEKAQKKIHEAGLPPYLADRLARGA